MGYKPDPSIRPPDLTVQQAMAYLQLSPRHIFRLCKTGEIESYKLAGTRRIPQASLDRFRQDQIALGSQFAKSTGKGPVGRPKKPHPAAAE